MKPTDIPQDVKRKVAQRDSFDGHPCCVLCGTPAPADSPLAFSCAHIISRAQGGLGTVENIVTLCPRCHRRYDQTAERDELRKRIINYLDWRNRKNDSSSAD